MPDYLTRGPELNTTNGGINVEIVKSMLSQGFHRREDRTKGKADWKKIDEEKNGPNMETIA